MRKALIAITILGLALASCRNQKDLIYFPDLHEETIINPTPQEDKDYKIRENDILYIRVLSISEDVNKIFQAASGTSSQTSYMVYQEGGIYYTGFSVKDDGYVDIPVIGEVMVKGLTIQEATEVIREHSKKELIDANIIVKLGNMKFTLLGEVKAPGTYINYKNQTTILEALGMAGDMTDYGDRKNVLVIRPTVEGVVSHRIDLNDKSLLSSPYYYMKPNDVIYVQPLKAKGTRMASQDYGVFIGIISSTLATASVVLTLILNLKK